MTAKKTKVQKLTTTLEWHITSKEVPELEEGNSSYINVLVITSPLPHDDGSYLIELEYWPTEDPCIWVTLDGTEYEAPLMWAYLPDVKALVEAAPKLEKFYLVKHTSASGSGPVASFTCTYDLLRQNVKPEKTIHVIEACTQLEAIAIAKHWLETHNS